MQTEPLLTDEHKEKRMKFANWIRANFRKENTMNILFSDEKMFDIDGVYNHVMTEYGRKIVQQPTPKMVLGKNVNFPRKVMVWLGVCCKGVSPLVIFESDTLDHDQYIKEVLPVALKYGNAVFGDD